MILGGLLGIICVSLTVVLASNVISGIVSNMIVLLLLIRIVCCRGFTIKTLKALQP